MKIAFHGANSQGFLPGFEKYLDQEHEIISLPKDLKTEADQKAFAEADIIVGAWFTTELPSPKNLKLYLVPGAGYDGIDLDALPDGVRICNCFGHENSIAEYVIASLLMRHIPLQDGDKRLRKGDWTYSAVHPFETHTEMGQTSIGVLGFGHIGKTVAARAKAFGMNVSVANRSDMTGQQNVDEYYPLDQLNAFMGSADAIVNTLPLSPETEGMIEENALAAMRSDAVIINVGRGAVISESALYESLKNKKIGGAVIDTWYNYPSADNPNPLPSKFPFQDLDNVLMTSHLSGWTNGTVLRRQKVMADNINRLIAGKELVNQVK